MEQESSDCDITMGKALREDKVLYTVYLEEKWNELLPKLKHPFVSVEKVRRRFEYHESNEEICGGDVPCLAMVLLKIWSR